MIQIATSTVSLLTPPTVSALPPIYPVDELLFRGIELEAVGEGIMSGFEARRSAVPVKPTEAESMKPGVERSIRYQRTGLTRKRVKEA